MPYDISYDCEAIDVGDIFQSVDRERGVMIGSDARDPLDYDEYVIPRTTPFAPVRFASVEVGANTHDAGVWMPIRRALVLTVPGGAITFTVTDANPFHTGDHIISIDATGPVTGGGLNLALITDIDYTTDTITVANTAGLAQNDWVEVMENSCCALTAVVPSNWQIPQSAGMLLEPHDSRIKASATSGTVMPSTMVTHGSIREANINFCDDATDDMILIAQLNGWTNQSGGIEIITLEHGDEAVIIPDYPFDG